MITSEITSSSSEHWLTIMNCTICESTPDSSPVYKCPMGHVICGNCYATLRHADNLIRCKKCFSSQFKKHQTSNDFLRKLKIKPGIGRTRRYCQKQLLSNSSSDLHVPENTKKNITVEKLFRMDSAQVKELFQKKRKRANAPEPICIFRNYERGDMGTLDKDAVLSIALNGEDNIGFEASLSKKPVVCPHHPCKKIVTISSFAQHFQYDHRNIPVFNMERGKELHTFHNAEELEYGVTFCLAIINIEEVGDCEKSRFDTFWVMVSGSSEKDALKAYVVYWILTTSTNQFHCTLEVSSSSESTSCSTFCGVTRVYDSSNPLHITHDLNCLFLTYSSMCNLLNEGSKLNLRVGLY